MAVTVSYNLFLRVTETLALAQDLAANPDQLLTLGDIKGTLTSSTSVPATKAWSDTRGLTAGTDSIDLTALTRGSDLSDVDFTGLKVQLLIIQTAAANTADVVFKDGASNAYLLFGDASGQITLPAGTSAMFYLADKLADVSASVKQVDISSSDADAIYSMILVAG